eukprot:4749382-Prymnesium_polylepis.2
MPHAASDHLELVYVAEDGAALEDGPRMLRTVRSDAVDRIDRVSHPETAPVSARRLVKHISGHLAVGRPAEHDAQGVRRFRGHADLQRLVVPGHCQRQRRVARGLLYSGGKFESTCP